MAFITVDPTIYGEMEVTVLEELGVIGLSKDFSIFPNPFSNELNIRGEFISHIEIYDMLGRPIRAQAIESTEAIVNLNSITPGIYILKIISGSFKKQSYLL